MDEYPTHLYGEEGLIVLAPDGKLYSNQTNGVCCDHPEARGRFYPWRVPEEIKSRLCCACIDAADWDYCDRIFAQIGFGGRCRREHGSTEAWLWVELWGGAQAVITWPNCD